MKTSLSADTRSKNQVKPATFGAFNTKVKAPHQKRAKKYGDVTVTRYENGEPIAQHIAKAPRRVRYSNGWEPEETLKS